MRWGWAACFALVSLSAVAQEKHVIMGAGPSTSVVSLYFDHLSRVPGGQDYLFEVAPRSIKHAGGIQSTETHLFGRTGRPLNENEKAQNKKEIILARIPIAIVAGPKAGVRNITLRQLEDIFTRKVINWSELGGADHPILLVGREPTEAVFTILKSYFPFFARATFDKTLTRDHQVVNFLRSSKGDYAIAFGAKSNFDDQFVLNVQDFQPTVNIGLVYDAKNSAHPLVRLAEEQARGAAWHNLLKQTEFLPPQ